MRELSDDEVFGATKELSDADVFGTGAAPEASWKDNLLDPLAMGLKIGPTAVKGVADIARLLTGDRVGVDTSNAMKTGMESIDQVVGSDALRAQKTAVNQALQDQSIGLTDLPRILLDNPRASADAAVSTIGSMFLPTGVAAGVTKALPLAARLAPAAARIAPTAAATGASVVTGAAQNAAETFADTEGQDMADRYTGAGISGAASLLLGRLLGGGAEGVVARRMAGEAGARGALAVGKSALKTGAKEFGQEFGEESSNYVGKQVAKNEAIDPNTMGKQGLYGGILGFGVGGVSDVATSLGDVKGRAPQPEPQPAPQPAPQPDQAPVTSELVQRILGAIEQTQDVKDPPQRTAQPEAQAPAVETPAPAGIDAAATDGVPAAPAAPSVETAGVELPDVSTNTPEMNTSTERAQKTPEIEQVPVTQPAQPTQDAPILQNRNRATPSSIAQMQSIAANPDYGRLGFSRDFANGAPVVAGGQVAPEQLGRQDVAVASDGRRIPVQYAVVEAADVLPSNRADGTPNADYGNQTVQRIRAIAGNGRIAGLQAAHSKGTTANYLNELQGDPLHGVSPDVIRSMRAPVLVRVMPNDQVTADIGDVSNTVGNLNLSAVEQANNDAQRINLDALQFSEDGGITAEAVRQFVRAMPQAEQGGLIDTNGQPTKQAVDRISAAVFAKAYGNDQLVRLFAQAQDPEARVILSALAQVAPKMARLEGAGALDIRGVVTQAAEIAVNARREGKPLARAAQQLDMAADPDVAVFLDLFAANPRSVKPVVDALSNVADFAYTEATKPTEDMFGEVPRASRADVLNQLKPQNEQRSQENLEDAAGRGPAQVDDGRAEANTRATEDTAATEAGRPTQEEVLTSYTPEEVTQRQDQQEQAELQRQQQDRESEQRAQADAERNDFTLTGSNRDADVAAARGQTDIFSAPAESDTTKDSGPEIPVNESRPAPSAKTIDDFGEKLGGAKKDMAPSLTKELTDDDIATQPFSKIWPADEVDGIEDKFAAAVAFAARAEVPAKPRVAYKVARWVENVKMVRGLAQSITSGKRTPAEFMDKLRELRSLKAFGDKIELLNAIDRSQWARIGTVEAFPDAYRFDDAGQKVPSQFTRVEIDGKTHNIPTGSVVAAIERVDDLLAGEAAAKKMQFEIRRNTNTGEVFINKKGDKEYRKLKTFADAKQARAFISNNYDDLVAAWESVKESDNVKKTDVRSDVNRARTGADRRNGKDVTPEQFSETFGFRGVEFGNWVGQGANGKERQGMLNQAYDALLDLADIVGIPPKAISLNGSMGLAFGSRGSGKAAAHFEPDNLVINLTKTKGAGSLAHEWFHALDNYFARQRGGEVPIQRGMNAQQAYRANNFITYRPEPLYIHKSKTSTPITKAKLQRYHEQNPKSDYYNPDNWQVDPKHPNGVRPEVERAFAELVEALEQSPMSQRAASLDKTPEAYWSRIIERAARAFENFVISKMMERGYQNDYLANVRPIEDFPRSKDRYPYLLPEEVAPIAESFGNLFGTIQTKETDKGVMLYEPGADYNAEAPRRKYTDDRQLQLFLDSEPDPSQSGPAVDRARREAVAAVDDLRSTSSILAQALSGDYAARQRVSLVGQKVSSAEDLAVLAQVYRDPRFETFRVVFVNDGGAVVSQVGLTSRLPASTAAIMGSDTDAYLGDLSATARNVGATGFYLLHNHPSGIANPSRADVALTRNFAQKMPMLAFKSHVVIDTNEYSTIEGDGDFATYQKDFGQPTPYRAQEWADVKISGPADVMAMAKRLQVDEDAVTLVHTDSQYNVKAISTLPVDVTRGDKADIQRHIAKASLKVQGSQVFAVSRNGPALQRVGSFVRDGIHVLGNGTVKSLAEAGLVGGQPFPSDRRTRVSPDTSPEFNYLRKQPKASAGQRAAESLPNLNQDIVLEIPVEGGKTARLTINAEAYLNQLDAREEALRMVKECMA